MLPRKRRQAAGSSSSYTLERTKKHEFTPRQETYLAQLLADPKVYVILNRPGGVNNGSAQPKLKTYGVLATKFNRTFGTALEPRQIENKANRMLSLWRPHVKRKGKQDCHFYNILKPTWGIGVATPDENSDISAPTVASDTDDEGDGDGMQAISKVEDPGLAAGPSEKTQVVLKGTAETSLTQPQDLLDMLKEIKEASILNGEAREKEQARREQLLAEVRGEVQREVTRREELRLEEVRLREEESTRRESIRAGLRMKELEIEHVDKMLRLEKVRIKRMMLERERT